MSSIWQQNAICLLTVSFLPRYNTNKFKCYFSFSIVCNFWFLKQLVDRDLFMHKLNFSSFTPLSSQVRKYGNELEGLWVTGASSKLSCDGGEGRERVKGRRLVVVVREAVTKKERIVGCSTKME